MKIIFKRKYSARWADDKGINRFYIVPIARVGIELDVPEAFARIAIAAGAAYDPADGPVAPPADEPVRADKMERGSKKKGRRQK